MSNYKKMFLMLLVCVFLSLFVVACDSDDDGTGAEGESEGEGECEGECDREAGDFIKCIESSVNVCVCDGGQWKKYDCAAMCEAEAKTSNGCGDAGLDYDYCICVFEGATDCQGACTPETDEQFCNTQNENALCFCDPDSNEWVYLDCVDSCIDLGFLGSDECALGDIEGGGQAEVCMCDPGVCFNDQECVDKQLGDICVMTATEGTVCAYTCELAMCDCTAGTEACVCDDVNLADGLKGACLDLDATDPSCTVGEGCGNEPDDWICLTDQSSKKYCMEYCTMNENPCEAGESCHALVDQQDNIVGGVCLAD